MITSNILKQHGFYEWVSVCNSPVFCYNRKDAAIGCFLFPSQGNDYYIPYVGIFADLKPNIMQTCPCTKITDEAELIQFVQWLSSVYPK